MQGKVLVCWISPITWLGLIRFSNLVCKPLCLIEFADFSTGFKWFANLVMPLYLSKVCNIARRALFETNFENWNLKFNLSQTVSQKKVTLLKWFCVLGSIGWEKMSSKFDLADWHVQYTPILSIQIQQNN